MHVTDFAELHKSYGQGTGTNKWVVTNPTLLEQYFAAASYRPSILAAQLGINYSAIKRLLYKADLWKLAKLNNYKSGGRPKTAARNKNGYVYATADHDYYDSAGDKQRRFVHQVVAEQMLKRPLHPNELVHHINLDKSDNRPENLYVTDNSIHRKIHSNLEHLAARMIEAGYISFVPELEEYIYIGPQPKLEYQFPSGGFIAVKDVLGSDATVVNAARVSFGKSISEVRDQDKRLLTYLSTNNHTSPFRHCYIQFHIKAPEFVARQWYKHIVGSDYSFKDTAWNEISGRYIEYDVEPWIPTTLRQQSADKKQGSSAEPIDNEIEYLELYKAATEQAFEAYKALLKAGVCKEQARTLLGLNFYTEWYWTASLQAIFNFVELRNHPHAQVEIQEYAQQIDNLVTTLFPNAWKALKDSVLSA